MTARTIQWGSKGAQALHGHETGEGEDRWEAGQPDRRHSRAGQYERCIYSRHACRGGPCPRAVGRSIAMGVARNGRRGRRGAGRRQHLVFRELPPETDRWVALWRFGEGQEDVDHYPFVIGLVVGTRPDDSA
jgi:hypothetical protein